MAVLIDRDRVKKVFQEYTDRYDSTKNMIRLKIEHTYRVAAIADRVARSMELSKEDVDLAWLIGMLHDIARFEQVKRYGTFVDSKSIDHGALACQLLFDEGMIRDYIDDPAEDENIRKAIKNHNQFEIEEGLNEREMLFAKLIRDADKVDIMKVCVSFPIEDIYEVPEEEFYLSEISDESYADSMQGINVIRNHVHTAVDHLVSHASLVYGLYYRESFKIVEEQGYLSKMLAMESKNPDTAEKLVKLREKIEDFMQQHI